MKIRIIFKNKKRKDVIIDDPFDISKREHITTIGANNNKYFFVEDTELIKDIIEVE